LSLVPRASAWNGSDGVPVALAIFRGNTSDHRTVDVTLRARLASRAAPRAAPRAGDADVRGKDYDSAANRALLRRVHAKSSLRPDRPPPQCPAAVQSAA